MQKKKIKEERSKEIDNTDNLKYKGQVDFILLITTLILVFIGIIMVFSSSWPEALKDKGNQFHFVRRQIVFAIIGFLFMVVLMNIDYRNWKDLSFFIYLVSLGTVALVFTPLGIELLGAKRWVKLGPVTFMPGDVVKIGSIIFFANFLANKRKDTHTFNQGTIPALIIIGISVGSIMIQQDLGTTITLAGTLMAMFIVGGMNLMHLIPLFLTAAAGAIFLFKKAVNNPESKNAFRVKRILSFRDPFADAQATGWQAVQSLYALGSGGFWGLGLGKSKQKFFYIPEPYTDFIFAIIGEEVGLLGASIVIILYMILICRGVKIALNVRDDFGMYLATGITALIAIQTIIHIAVVTSSIPTTGITLPFISYGGTSLVIYMASVGILLNVSKSAKNDRDRS